MTLTPQSFWAPELKDQKIKRFINNLNATHEPLYIDLDPESNGSINDCFNIVNAKIKEKGGKMILGWSIWASKNVIEAEAHAVWEDDLGEIHDITPKIWNMQRILFVEDENLVYEGKQIDNVRFNINKNPIVYDLFKVREAIFRFNNKGERAHIYDLSSIINEKQKEFFFELQYADAIINTILHKNGTIKSKCPCNSGNKYIHCHQPKIADLIKMDL